jgi:dolichyl-phosphate beta-glucosyltransferase
LGEEAGGLQIVAGLVWVRVVSVDLSLSAPCDVLLVIPVFRDAERLAVYLPTLLEAVAAENLPVRMRVVDDGSGGAEAEQTRRVVDNLREGNRILEAPLLLPTNRGKGGAVFAGWAEAGDAEWLAFVDADGATPPCEVVRLLQHVLGDSGACDGWIGSRIKMLGRQIERSLRRHLIGRVYATLASELTGLPVYDSQCGCKVVRAVAFRTVAEYLHEERFGFDIELLWNLHRAGFSLREFPLDWTDVPGSKVRLFRDSWIMFCSLLRLRREVLRHRETAATNVRSGEVV